MALNVGYDDPSIKMYFSDNCILSEKIEKSLVIDELIINKGKDYPVTYDNSISPLLQARVDLNNILLHAEVMYAKGGDAYTYELGYVNINKSRNTESFDNAIQVIRRPRGDTVNKDIYTERHLDGLFKGYIFKHEINIDGTTVVLTLDGRMNNGAYLISNDSALPLWVKQQIADTRYAPKETIAPAVVKDLIVKRVGEKLYIGSKYSATHDLIICFAKAMFNELMTFSLVGLATNADATVSPDVERAISVNLNEASSDNIGPINTGGGWVGANHSLMAII